MSATVREFALKGNGNAEGVHGADVLGRKLSAAAVNGNLHQIVTFEKDSKR